MTVANTEYSPGLSTQPAGGNTFETRSDNLSQTDTTGTGQGVSTPYLFVYGTLRPGSGHPMAELLAAKARLVQGAIVRGRLYDLGPYPGLTPGEGSVRGELYELYKPAATLELLDRYEGCPDGEAAAFDREVVTVPLEQGASAAAWVYYFRGPVREDQYVASGDYFALLRRKAGASG
jgi:gamma-glutamylcyclotransferase (GGCT)/AIG2-like uncharacterized protein YtfP